MKIIFLALLILFFVESASAQTSVYHPFPDSNAIWRERTWFVDGLTLHEHKYQLFLSGDSVIGAHLYHKLYITGETTDYAYPQGYIMNYWFHGTSFHALIRQDTAANRVFTFDAVNQCDTLLYDFDLEVGDTLPDSYNHSLSTINPIIVTGIDSVLDGSNYRKLFLISPYPGLIEGIGCISGLFYSLDQMAVAGELNCFISDDTVKYTDGSINACVLVDAIEVNTKSAFSISPNPFHNDASLSISGFISEKISTITIFNSLGEAVRTETISQFPFIIERSELNNGLYIFTVKTSSGIVGNGKFILY